MTLPKISVLMVNYNHDTHISSAIESVLSQTYSNIQFIIVDDGSTDSSREIIQSYAVKDSRIEYYFTPENRHICHATNLGFTKIKGEYTARIDSDDLWYPNRLEAQLNYMSETPGCEICFSTIDLIDENGEIINQAEKDLYNLFQSPPGPAREEWLRFFFFAGNCLCHSSVLMKSHIIEEIGGFNLAYRQIHDFDYWVRIAKKYPIYVMKESFTALRRFIASDVINTSSTNEVDTTRYINEYFMLRKAFFDDMDRELFMLTFGPFFRNSGASGELELECEKAFLLNDCEYSGVKIPILGLLKFEELFADAVCADILQNTYNFTPIDFYRLNGQHLLNDHFLQSRASVISELQSQIREKDAHIANLEENISHLDRALNTITNSTVWRASAPLRRAMDKVKKR